MPLTKTQKMALQYRFNPDEPKKLKESEKVLERKLKKWIKEAGGMCIKLSSQHDRGLPDRMILLPKEQVFYCELKSTGKKPTKMQEVLHNEIRALGFRVYVVDSIEGLSEMLKAELLKNEKI